VTVLCILIIILKRKEVKVMATDRRAGPRQGPYVSNGKLPRSRNDDGTWRGKRSDAGKKRLPTGPKKPKK